MVPSGLKGPLRWAVDLCGSSVRIDGPFEMGDFERRQDDIAEQQQDQEEITNALAQGIGGGLAGLMDDEELLGELDLLEADLLLRWLGRLDLELVDAIMISLPLDPGSLLGDHHHLVVVDQVDGVGVDANATVVEFPAKLFHVRTTLLKC